MERENPSAIKKVELLKDEALDELWELRALLEEEPKTREECYQAFLKMERSEEEFAMFEVGYIRACEMILK